MEVISNDFVPIQPYNTSHLSIGAGERYDVVVTATEDSGNFWMRSIPQLNCTKTTNVNDVLGIIRYAGSNSTVLDDTAVPTTLAWDFTDSCADEDPANLIPYLHKDPDATYDVRDDEVTAVINGAEVSWTMGGSAFKVDWADPSLQQIDEAGGFASNWTSDQHALVLPNANEWVYMYIQTTSAQAHPIHLHGHDFWVLASGWGNVSTVDLNLTVLNAPRRDVAMVPGNGYLVIAFYTDNPGVNCNILPLRRLFPVVKGPGILELIQFSTGLATSLPHRVAYLRGFCDANHRTAIRDHDRLRYAELDMCKLGHMGGCRWSCTVGFRSLTT